MAFGAWRAAEIGIDMKTIIEPFKIKMVEPIRLTTPQEREDILKRAHFNLFQVAADDVVIDLLTDSGTSAMSAEQWAGIMRGDEAYAGGRSWFRFEAELRDLTGMPHVLPTHQGRAAERILFELIGGAGKVIPSNNHFDTTRANIEHSGATAVDLVIDEGTRKRPASVQREHRRRSPGEIDRRTRSRADSGLHDHRHQQQRRRPTGQPRKPPPSKRALSNA